MTDVPQLAVRDTKAAKMLDVSAAAFRRMVERGAMPPPVTLDGEVRWRVDQLKACLDAKAALPDEDFEL